MVKRVEQSLGGMLVGAVSGVEDAALTQRASWCAAPDALCLITTASAPMASNVSAVSFRLSPLATLDLWRRN